MGGSPYRRGCIKCWLLGQNCKDGQAIGKWIYGGNSWRLLPLGHPLREVACKLNVLRGQATPQPNDPPLYHCRSHADIAGRHYDPDLVHPRKASHEELEHFDGLYKAVETEMAVAMEEDVTRPAMVDETEEDEAEGDDNMASEHDEDESNDNQRVFSLTADLTPH